MSSYYNAMTPCYDTMTQCYDRMPAYYSNSEPHSNSWLKKSIRAVKKIIESAETVDRVVRYKAIGSLVGVYVSSYVFNLNPIPTVLAMAIGGVVFPILLRKVLGYHTSLLDHETVLDNENWAVTLVSAVWQKGWTGLNVTHAEIIIERMEDTFYRMQIVHLRAKGIENKFIDKPEDLKIYARSETWLRSKEKVQKMLEDVYYDEQFSRIGFNYIGSSSIGSIILSGENCISWARGKLALININLPWKISNIFVSLPSSYTSKSPIKGVFV